MTTTTMTCPSEGNRRVWKLEHLRKVLQYSCCAPHKGENQYGRKARHPRPDRYKNYRR